MADAVALFPSDAVLRARARAPVEEAVRSHFASLGRLTDEATLREVGSIVLRGLTQPALARIASSGLSSTELIRALIPQPAQAHALRPFNWSAITPAEIARLRALGLLGAPHVRAALAAQGADDDARADGADASGYSSSFHSDDAYLRSPAGMAMQRCARMHGLGWALNRPDVLRLGEEAIRLFARTQFRRESFEGLRGVGMQGRDIARLVRRAEESGQNANEVARVTKDTLRLLTEAQRRELLNALNAYHNDPGNAEAWRNVDRALRRIEAGGTPQQREQARRQREVEERMRQAQAREAEARARAEREAVARAREETERLTTQRRAEQEAAERLAAQRRGPGQSGRGQDKPAMPMRWRPCLEQTRHRQIGPSLKPHGRHLPKLRHHSGQLSRRSR